MCLAVLDAGRVVGAIGINRPKPEFDPMFTYLLSDFPVAPTDYRHLAKLVVLAVTSVEAQQLMQNQFSLRVVGTATTAFSNNPVSMKYRGVGKMTSRVKSKDPAWKFNLNYAFTVGGHTLAEGFQRWADRWGQLREPANA